MSDTEGMLCKSKYICCNTTYKGITLAQTWPRYKSTIKWNPSSSFEEGAKEKKSTPWRPVLISATWLWNLERTTFKLSIYVFVHTSTFSLQTYVKNRHAHGVGHYRRADTRSCQGCTQKQQFLIYLILKFISPVHILNNMLNNMLLSKFIMPIFIAYFKYMYMYFGLNCSADTITSCITKLTGLASVFIASFIIGLFYQVAL